MGVTVVTLSCFSHYFDSHCSSGGATFDAKSAIRDLAEALEWSEEVMRQLKDDRLDACVEEMVAEHDDQHQEIDDDL